MQFEYLYEVKATGSIEIDDIGNVALEAINTTLYQEYFLIIKTELGVTKVIEYGPVYIDELRSTNNPPCIDYTYNEFQYSTSKLKGIIEKFLTNPKRCISQVNVVDIEYAKENIINLVRLL